MKKSLCICIGCIGCIGIMMLCSCAARDARDTEQMQEYIKELENRVDELDEKVEKLDSSISVSSYNKDYSSTVSEPTCITPRTLGNGTYVVGTDIDAGKYNLEARSGYGKIKGDFASGFLSMGFGISDRYPEDKTYNGLVLTDGDEFEISHGVSIEFTPVY